MPAPLLAVDGPSLLYRAFFALPKSITNGDGQPVNALLGALNMVFRVVADRQPRAVVMCFGVDAADYRVELYDGYHAERPPVPDELGPQFEDSAAFFGAFGWYCHGHDSLEADDLLGAYGRVEADAGGEALLLTGDRDMFQCVDDAVHVLYVRTGSKVEEIDAAEVRKRYGVPPELVPDFIALRGDPSDGLPGAKGIGEKTAADLLQRHGSLEAAMDNWSRERPARVAGALRDQREELERYKQIATLTDVAVERPPDTPTDFEGGARAARERGMNRLAERLDKAG